MAGKSDIEIAELRRIWKAHPEVFIKDVLDITLTPNQLGMINAIMEHNEVTVRSSNSTGKSFLLGALVLWYFYVHISDEPFKNTIIIILSKNFIQIKDGIFAKFSKNIEIANKNLSEIYGKAVKLFPKDVSADQNRASYHYDADNYILGTSTDNCNALSGKHASNVFVIYEEAQGISDSVFSAMLGITQSGRCKQLMIGNTTLPDGCSGNFYQSFQEGSTWHQVKIDAFSTPNFKMTGVKLDDYFLEEDDPSYWRNKCDRFAKTNYKEALKKNKVSQWENDVISSFGIFEGLQNPISVYKILSRESFNIAGYEVATRVLANFTDGNAGSVYPSDWIETSMKNWSDLTLHVEGDIIISLDAGRGVGKDRSAISIINGNKQIFIEEENYTPIELEDRVVDLYREYDADRVQLECNGEGYLIASNLRRRGCKVLEVDVGSSAGYGNTRNYLLKEKTKDLKKRYNLKRDELAFNLRNKINPVQDENEPMFLIFPDGETRRQMRAFSYKRNDKNQITVTKKDELRKRLKRSPDKLDALLVGLADIEDSGLNDFNIPNFHFKSIKRD